VSGVIGSWNTEILLPKNIDDSCTKMIKSFTDGGLTYTNILIHGVYRETIRENANNSSTLLESRQASSSYNIIPTVEVRIHILNCLDNP
jgi:hypothetical protein